MARKSSKTRDGKAVHSDGDGPRKQNRAARTVVWVILALVILGLGGYGATNFGGRIEAIGSVGKTPIGVTRYSRALNEQLQSLQAQTGQSFTLAQLQTFGLDRAVLGRVVSEVALEDEAARVGLSVGDAEVSKQIREIQAFRGLDGNFDRQAYSFALDRSGMDAAAFEAGLRAEIARSIVQAGALSGVRAPQVYVDTLVGYIGETRDASWALIGPDLLDAPVGTPNDADLAAYYQANPDAYTLPETRRITYVWLTPDMLVDGIEVDDAALRELYDARAQIYNQPERRLVERLVFGDNAKAAEAKARLDAGSASFEDLVAERGLTLEDIDLGDVTEADLGPAGAAVFAMTEPGVAGPVDTDLGPALIRMNAALPAQSVSFDEARPELLAEFASDRARRQVSEEIEPIDDLLAGGATLEEMAAETDLELGQIGWTPDTRDGIAGYEEFRSAAAALAEGDFPEVLELPDGGIFAVRLDAVEPPALQPLDVVRDQVLADWQAETQRLRLAELAAAYADEIRSGADMLGLGFEVLSELGLKRDSFVADAPTDFATTLFDMDPGELRVLQGDEAAFLIRLDAVHAADPSDPDVMAARESLEQRAQQGLAQDIVAALTSAVQETSGLELDRAAINAVHAQFP